MLSVSLSDVLLNEIIRRVVFSAFTGVLWLLIVFGVLRLFNVKNPAVKHVFFALTLYKSFAALIREQPEAVLSRGKISAGFQFPSPFAVLPNFPDVGKSFYWGSSSIAFGPGVVVLAAAVFFLLWRFLGLVRFYRIINRAPELDRETHEVVYEILDSLIAKTQIASPRVILINANAVPFTVGLRRSTIALSQSLLKRLNKEETEAVLAHEVGHIARRDHLYHWLIVIMRDVLFFNPPAHIIYRRLNFERERACDDFSSQFCKPLALAKSLVKVAELRDTEPVLGLAKSFAPQSFLSSRQSCFSSRVAELLEPKPYAVLSWPKRIFLWLGAFTFFYVEIHIVALLGGTPVIFS